MTVRRGIGWDAAEGFFFDAVSFARFLEVASVGEVLTISKDIELCTKMVNDFLGRPGGVRDGR